MPHDRQQPKLRDGEPARGAEWAGRVGIAILAAAMLVAPFLALAYRREAGLVVMAAALIATAALLRDALSAATGRAHRLLLVAIAVNVVLALACLAVVTVLVLGG